MSVEESKLPLLKRYSLWSKTRYPIKNWIFSSLVYVALVLYLRASLSGAHLRWEDLWQGFAIGCFFLLLRIYDEHKDYEIDLKYHPERPVARGLVTLGELKYLFVFALVAQVLVNVFADGGLGMASVAWVVSFLWSLLMAKEFFVGEWLQTKLLLYATSHMVIMFPLAYWIIYFGDPSFAIDNLNGVCLASLVFLTGAIGELARKTKSPQDEIEGVDSYSSVLGVKGVLGALFTLDIIFLGIFLYLATRLQAYETWQLVLTVGLPTLAFLLALFQGLSFAKGQGDGQGKKVEDSQGGLILFVFVGLILSATLGGVS